MELNSGSAGGWRCEGSWAGQANLLLQGSQQSLQQRGELEQFTAGSQLTNMVAW